MAQQSHGFMQVILPPYYQQHFTIDLRSFLALCSKNSTFLALSPKYSTRNLNLPSKRCINKTAWIPVPEKNIQKIIHPSSFISAENRKWTIREIKLVHNVFGLLIYM